MADASFRRDLYRGTAAFYDAYRVPYPPSLAADLVHRTGADGQGALLDLAAGTGQVSFLLAPYFRTVLAVDQEPDMVALGTEKALSLGTSHVRFLKSPVESVSLPAGAFALVSVGNAFHRLPRDTVASLMSTWVASDGFVALLWSDNPWAGDRPWQRALAAVIRQWQSRLGAENRIPAGYARSRAARTDETVLAAHGFRGLGKFTFPTPHRWTPDSLIGFAYSTSVLAPSVMGTHREAFEADVRQVLEPSVEADGVAGEIPFAYELFSR
jgi:SAM-dependent methyltransferase